jgi:hypothetical protein
MEQRLNLAEESWKFVVGDVPHDDLVNDIVLMDQHVAERDDLPTFGNPRRRSGVRTR